MSNRDLGIRGGPGKGDNDRTENVEQFKKNLESIPFNPQDKTGFKKVGEGRFVKRYDRPAPAPSVPPAEPEAAPPLPTPSSLMLAARSKRRVVGGSSEY